MANIPNNVSNINQATLSKIARQKSAGNRILENLAKYFKTEEVYLAGGMLRDHYFNKPGNDFDIYLECPLQVDSSIAEIMINGIEGFKNFSIMTPEDSEYAGYNNFIIDFVLQGKFENPNINFRLEEGEEFDTQIIFLKHYNMPPYAYFQEAFCCSLSKVWQQYQRDPVYHRDFLDTIVSNTIKFDWSYTDYNINYKYINKILNRYPEFEVDKATIGNYLRELCYR